MGKVAEHADHEAEHENDDERRQLGLLGGEEKDHCGREPYI